ncbi:MAG TPA: adenylate/guanylate cyclase domain-containing protein [Gaiellaceae bacterium]|nr:adenylate/guanylate cyclase domain-containing protein [Gaiellaceae bacterium]
MRTLPTGTVTFLFTDIEGSTPLMRQLGDRYGDVLAEERRLLREATRSAGGEEIDTQGDAFFFSFTRARDAVTAAVAAQRALAEHEWPEGAAVRVRMGLHTGEPSVGDEGYLGLDVVRAARICSAGHGGQILLSETTRALLGNDVPAGVNVRDLGTHHLKDVQQERIFELALDDQPLRHPRLRPERPRGRARADVLGDEFQQRINDYVQRTVEQSLAGEPHTGRRKPPATPPLGSARPTRLGFWIVATIIVGIIVILLVVKFAFL